MKRFLSTLLSVLLALTALVAPAFGEAAGLDVVATDKGQVSGVFENGVTYFKGIPFAKPPVGDLRWAEPQDAEAWEGVRACDAYAPMAMQILSTSDWWGSEFYYDWMSETPPMSEDCLYLNVVTPATKGDEKLPVLVWFHGGANMHGYSWEPEFEPSKLATKGVVVVSVEYRMGVFGWMTTKALSEATANGTSGNYGLMDQIQSLRWVKKNIAAFGGDPSRVTISGQSAGAGNCTSLLTSPLAQDLFQQAIMDSSFGALGTRPTQEQTQEKCEAYLEVKGYGKLSVEELRALPTEAFMNAETQKSEVYGRGFAPCLDGYVLTESPKDFFLKEGALTGK
ncbi:MAG: carboxylesterase family protein, partial [Clostridia bacterium]